ncbi:hypothetical protein OHB26_00175 [Nocardia sp. NBC_01503]|uniref:hypothetical protein n=1 Tax=Nocardia sp. NBC_01503 TaxID=2975997 RepID=UPI002E7B68E4|nr:hypothetical protein [Nocardia sp. NBC_01503]WTL32732.1 hypothetical protein OHB26_00175 [Nocardia sp. NBC_01503]
MTTELHHAFGLDQQQLNIHQWQRTREPAREAFEQFIAAIRQELRLHSVDARFFSYVHPTPAVE